ncbi:putative amino-acid metabolite efflux pump [compost metagenome]
MQTTPLSLTSRLPRLSRNRKRDHGSRDVIVACVQMIFCTLFWGAFYVLGKLAVLEAPPLVVATLRFLIAGSVLYGMVLVREKGLPRLSPSDRWLVLGLGFTGVFAFNLLTFQGFLHAPATDATLINPSLNPVLTAIMATFLFNEKLWRTKIYGMGLSVLGLAILFASHPVGAPTGDRLLGDGLFVLSALAWSLYTLLSRVAVKRFSSLVLTTYTALAGLLLLLPLSVRDLLQVPWAALSWRFWISIAMLAILCTVFSFLLWNGAIRRAGASRTASFLPLVPMFGLALGALILREEFTPIHGVVAACSIGGVYLANKPKHLRIKAKRTIKRARIAALRSLNQVRPAPAMKAPLRYTNQLSKPKRIPTGFLG